MDYTFTTSISDDYQTLLLMSSKAKITITNPLSYNVSTMEMAIEFDEFVLEHEVVESLVPGGFGGLFIPTIDKFKGDFTVSK